MPSHDAIQSDRKDKLISTFRDSEDMFEERAVDREVEVGIVGLHIGRAVVIVDTYEKYQLDVYI
jgi:hypothetical protein